MRTHLSHTFHTFTTCVCLMANLMPSNLTLFLAVHFCAGMVLLACSEVEVKRQRVENPLKSSTAHEGTEGQFSGGCGLQDRCARGIVLRTEVSKYVTVQCLAIVSFVILLQSKFLWA